jgi:hypothetical protein
MQYINEFIDFTQFNVPPNETSAQVLIKSNVQKWFHIRLICSWCSWCHSNNSTRFPSFKYFYMIASAEYFHSVALFRINIPTIIRHSTLEPKYSIAFYSAQNHGSLPTSSTFSCSRWEKFSVRSVLRLNHGNNPCRTAWLRISSLVFIDVTWLVGGRCGVNWVMFVYNFFFIFEVRNPCAVCCCR